VWLEIGWFWGRLGLARVMILSRGTVNVPSDLHGVERYEYEGSARERAKEIAAFLAAVGGAASGASPHQTSTNSSG
jgi:predicted nucleotide-binding protein